MKEESNFVHRKLENGLEVAEEILPCAKSLSIAFFVRCGSRDETPEVSGISHFLEHMIFKGSSSRSAQDVNREFDSLGISFNAGTSLESTIFYAMLLPEYLEECLALYADILRPIIREDDFVSEKEVILEEIGMYENEPPYCVDDRLRQKFFNGHPLGNPVLGSSQSVKRLKSSQLQSWIQEKYAPKNITLCACGNVDFEQLVILAEKYCGQWENPPEKEGLISPVLKTAEFLPKLGFESFSQRQAARQYFLSCGPFWAKGYRERLACRLISSILGGDVSSRLYWEFVDSGRAGYADLVYSQFSDAGYFSTSLACEPEDASENWRRLEKIYRGAEDGDISERELSLAQNRIATAVVLDSEKAWERIFSMGAEWTSVREYHSAEEEVETLRSITLEEINRVLEKKPLTQALTFCFGPKKIRF